MIFKKKLQKVLSEPRSQHSRNSCITSKINSSDMAKSKSHKPLCIPQKHLHSRISFLYQAATYLASVQSTEVTPTPAVDVSGGLGLCSVEVDPSTSEPTTTTVSSVPVGDCGASYPDLPASSIRESAPSRQLLSHLHAVSRKAQISLSPKIKHSICKRCHTLLVTGSNCHETLENLSRGSRKPWADVMVRRCLTCGTEKRTPTRMKRQAKKGERSRQQKSAHEVDRHGGTGTGFEGSTSRHRSGHT